MFHLITIFGTNSCYIGYFVFFFRFTGSVDQDDHSSDSFDTTNADDSDSDDFYGQTREIIIFAEKGNVLMK